MVGVVELESTTSTMSTWRSNQLSYTPSNQIENGIYYIINSRKVKMEIQKKRKKSQNQRGKYSRSGARPSNVSENSGAFVLFSVPHHQKGRRSLSSEYTSPVAVTGISG